MTHRNYPDRNTVSGDCPVCNKYQSMTTLNWRGLAFCNMKHLRRYMWDILMEEGIDECDEAWEELGKL